MSRIEIIRKYVSEHPYYHGALDAAYTGYDLALTSAQHARLLVNKVSSDVEPWALILITAASVLLVQRVFSFLFDSEEPLRARLTKSFFKVVRSLPFLGSRIKRELDSAIGDMRKSLNKPIDGSQVRKKLPAKGLAQSDILHELDLLRNASHVDVKNGRISGTVYFGDDSFRSGDHNLTDFLVEAYKKFALSNPLHSDVFPGIRKMEAEVVQMVVNLYNGDADCCGTMTSGGTESILMACKAYRDRGYERGITKPEMIIPESAHAAFDKAAGYFKIKLIKTPVHPVTRRADVAAIRKALTKNTVMIVGSCPSFPHGVIDPIEELSNLALEFGVGLHVDCCLGGFLVPFMKDAGFPLPKFDFSLPGVSSISCDTHKYGFSPKGSSVVMYSSKELRHYQYFVAPDWSGGIYASPSIAGSRPGALIASTWACLVYFGKDGYVQTTKSIIQATKYIAKEMQSIQGLFVYGNPDVSVVALGSKVFDIYRLGGMLNEKGWNLNQLQFPSSIHICVTYVHTRGNIAKEFVSDVRACVEEILKSPSQKAAGSAAIYGMSQAIPDRSLINYVTSGYLDTVYNADPYIDPSEANGHSKEANGHAKKKGKK